MNCDRTIELLDDYIDDLLSLEQHDDVAAHVDTCISCRQQLADLSALRECLRSMPVKSPPHDFAETILRKARRAHSHSRPSMFVAGAVAACLMLLLVAGILRMETDPATQPAAVHMVEMTVLEQRTISLAFNSPAEINDVTFILNLPEGVELNGYPDERELVWKDNLSNGKNVLQITLLGQKKMSGSLKATIEHDGKRREFNIQLQVREAGAWFPPVHGRVV